MVLGKGLNPKADSRALQNLCRLPSARAFRVQPAIPLSGKLRGLRLRDFL